MFSKIQNNYFKGKYIEFFTPMIIKNCRPLA